MVIFADKGYMLDTARPNEDFTGGEALYVVEDGTALADKIRKYAPYYDFVTTKAGKLKDVTPFDPPEIEEIPVITTNDLAIAIAEVAEQQAIDKAEMEIAIAELAEAVLGV